MAIVRPARLEDVDEIIDLGELLHGESGYSRLPFDRDKVGALICGLISEVDGVVFVAESDGRIIGGIAGGITEYWFCSVRHAFDFSFFVHPDHRGGSAAFRLLCAFERWAKDAGAVEIDIGITTGIHEEKTQRFYEKMGFVQSGRLFGKILEVGHGS